MSSRAALIFLSFATHFLFNFSQSSFCQIKSFDFHRFLDDDCVYREYLSTYDSLRDAGIMTYDYQSNECNLDNKIYLPGREFIYDFYHRKGGNNYKFDFSNRETGLASCDYRLENTVFSFSYKILPGNIVGQTQAWYGYQGAFDTIQNFEISGIIENKMNVWLHLPRSEMFRMLEINPFPFIKFPPEVGAVW